VVLSLTSPGVQSILDPATAVTVARDTNDLVRSSFVDRYPDRLAMFACLPTQDAEAAAAELERAVRDLGAVGALINGYTNVGDAQSGRYLDDAFYAPLWAKVAELDVPVYLHPREPLPAQTRIYDGYSSLVGSAWGFAHETATHAVRLMLSGLFDRHPGVQIILGHLGEGLPFLLPRLEHRLDKQREGVGLGQAQRRVSHYFNENFYVTTSGHFHTRTLFNTISEIGVDRVLFSADYPYEDMEEAAGWFDTSLLSHNDSVKVGRENARRLFPGIA
jgi:2,3-dihydroxybenzoate decarboxylase